MLALVEYSHDESLLTGLLAGVVAVAGSIVWLLVVRLVLETVVVLFRIHAEIDFGNALTLRPTRTESATDASGQPPKMG